MTRREGWVAALIVLAMFFSGGTAFMDADTGYWQALPIYAFHTALLLGFVGLFLVTFCGLAWLSGHRPTAPDSAELTSKPK